MVLSSSPTGAMFLLLEVELVLFFVYSMFLFNGLKEWIAVILMPLSSEFNNLMTSICFFPCHDLEIMSYALILLIIVITSSYFICLTLPKFLLLKLFPMGKKKKYNLYYFFSLKWEFISMSFKLFKKFKLFKFFIPFSTPLSTFSVFSNPSSSLKTFLAAQSV